VAGPRSGHPPPPARPYPAGVDPVVDDAEVAALLDSIPVTAERPRTVEDLPGGLTNRNLKVTTPSTTVVVRIPGGGSDLLGIDRDLEYRNSVAAAASGVGPPVLHYRPGYGITVGYLEGRTLGDPDLHDPGILAAVATACRRLHAGPRFAGEFDMFAVQARYRRIVAEHGFRLPDRYDEFAPTVERIRAALGPRRHTVPCHNDLLAENLLVVPDGAGGEEVKIIDYEYAGNNDPASSWATCGARPRSRRPCWTCWSAPTTGAPARTSWPGPGCSR
jgi:thiamine kinase-like enzyme